MSEPESVNAADAGIQPVHTEAPAPDQQIDLDSGSPPAYEEEPSPSERPPQRDSAAWASGLIGALMARVVFLPLAWVAAWLLADSTGPLQIGVLDLWAKWDASHLLVIAEHGYFAPESDAHAAAFFPLFPLTVKAFLWLGHPVVAGMAVTFAASVVAFRYLHGLSELHSPGTGTKAVAYLAFFPTALFLVSPYTEALFLAGAIAAFYLAKKQMWWWVGVPAAVAVASRAAGLFLLAGLAVEFAAQRDYSPRRLKDASLSLLMGVLPLIAYFTYLQWRTGNFFYYFQMQREGWGRSLGSPIDSFLLTWGTWNDTTASNWMMVWRLEVVAAMLGVIVIGWAMKRREWGYATYMGATLATLVTSTWYFSIPRMMLSFFPIALFMATSRYIRAEYAIAAFAAVAALGVIVFTSGAWFF